MSLFRRRMIVVSCHPEAQPKDLIGFVKKGNVWKVFFQKLQKN